MVRSSLLPTSLRFFMCAITLASLSACTQTNETSSVQITIPNFSNTGSKPISQSVSAQALPDPTALADLDCFAVFVGSDEPGLRERYCPVTPSNSIFKFGIMRGMVPKGGSITIDIPSGPKRSVHIVGFDTTAATCAKISETNADFDDAVYSDAFYLGSATQDLAPGPQSMPISVSYDPTKKLGDCNFGGGSGGGGSSFDLGNGADGDQVFSIASPQNLTALSYTNLAGNTRQFTAYRRVTNISGTAPLSLTINPATAQEFAAGDEVMLYIVGSSPGGPPSDCGDLYPGFKVPGRVAAYTSGLGSIQVNFSDARVATIPNANLAAGAVAGTPFCRATIVRVPNFRNLTFNLTSGGQLLAPSVSSLNSAENAGGIIAFRVQDVLQSTGSVGAISTKGAGYLQSPSGRPGENVLGYVSTPNTSAYNSGGGGGFSPGDYPGGGGHGGLGGDGSTTNGGNIEGDQFGCSIFDPTRKCLFGKMFMGAAGGTHNSSSSPTGAGGGVIAVYANKVVVPSGKTLSFKSHASPNSSPDDAGSAGGSVLIRARELNLSGNLFLSATGEVSTNAGGGGGGRVHLDVNQTCNTAGSTSIVLNVNGGGGTTNGGAGTKYISGPAITQLSCFLPAL